MELQKSKPMGLKDQPVARILIYQGEGTLPLDPAEKASLMQALLSRGFAVTVAGEGRAAPADESDVVVLGRFSNPDFKKEAVHSGWRWKDIQGHSEEQVAEWIQTARNENGLPPRVEWKPWFPVIDYDRCTNCLQCLSFCLFGVYGVDAARKIEVQNNDQCKTNCPACSRVCPEAAIMFPKYKSGPINGDMVSDADLQREKMKIDISALLGGDVYQMLRERSERAKSRFSKERDSDKALKERQKCLVKLAASVEIPPEVLMALPSRDEIERRAQEAAARYAAALK